MHNLPGFFLRKNTNNKKKSSSSSSSKMDQTPSPPPSSSSSSSKPRLLQRRNAAKNFEFTPSGCSSPSSTNCGGSGSSAHRTRSLDGGMERTSFRIDGYAGEVDSMLQSLGISTADFDIKDEWELMNKRSSSDVTLQAKKYHFDFDEPKPLKQDQEVPKFKPHRFSNGNSNNSNNNQVKVDGPVVVKGGGGIKGDRPPLLTPPPAMSLAPVLDDGCSTWDLLKGFAPDGDRVSRFSQRHGMSDDDEEEDEEVGGDDDNGNRDEEGVNDEGRIGVTENMSGSCSFTTTNDDDSSSTTTEPVSIISPNGGCRLNITHWEKGNLLGRGSFGTVYEGISSEGFFFAVKEVSLLEQGSQGRQSIYQLEQEIELLSQFEHENIVRYLGTDKDDGKLYIFLELVTQGSLATLYQKYHLRDSHVSAYTRQILLGLKYLHDRNVVHRDIKCANILVASTGAVKLADFGLAKATRLNDLKSCKGTAFWMAPEVVNHKNRGYGLAADIWSLGCTVLEMITGHVPYYPLEFMQALFRIGKGEPPPIPDTLSRDARDFIQQCLRVNPNDRPTAAELLDHSFVRRVLYTPLGSESPMMPTR